MGADGAHVSSVDFYSTIIKRIKPTRRHRCTRRTRRRFTRAGDIAPAAEGYCCSRTQFNSVPYEQVAVGPSDRVCLLLRIQMLCPGRMRLVLHRRSTGL